MTSPNDQSTNATQIHATAVALANQCVVLRGPSGSGKSDLALRCLAAPTSELFPIAPILVSDDQLIIERTNETLMARPPGTIFGKLEVRGIGIVDVPAISSARVRLVCDLVDPHSVQRLPEPNESVEILGISVPFIRVVPFESSAPLKVLMKLSQLLNYSDNDGLIT